VAEKQNNSPESPLGRSDTQNKEPLVDGNIGKVTYSDVGGMDNLECDAGQLTDRVQDLGATHT